AVRRPVRCLCPLLFSVAPAPTAISTLSLHDALPIYTEPGPGRARFGTAPPPPEVLRQRTRPRIRPRTDDPGDPSWRGPPPFLPRDRKSTRLNSSHVKISYAVFCLKQQKSGQVRMSYP